MFKLQSIREKNRKGKTVLLDDESMIQAAY